VGDGIEYQSLPLKFPAFGLVNQQVRLLPDNQAANPRCD
jgi:hypothetical protein